MTRIEVEHQGFKITFGDNTDTWSCWDLDLEHAKLSVLKTKINQYVKDKLKSASVIVGKPEWNNVTKLQIISRDNASGKFWCIDVGSGASNRRQLVSASNLIYWDDELQDKLSKAKDYEDEGAKWLKKARDIRESIKKLEPEEVETLINDLIKKVRSEDE